MIQLQAEARTAGPETSDIFSRRESEVRSYCRSFPVVFERARGASLWDEDGTQWLDFLAGAGAMNYGHNDPVIKDAVVRHLAADGIVHGLDLHTVAKRRFLEAFERIILAPRDLDHKVQFTGPTGTNAVEAAFKLARKATGRTTIMAFTNAYHGMSLGALAATGSSLARSGAGVPLGNVVFAPFDGYHGAADTAKAVERMLADASSGCDLPAAMVLETVQGEGGLNAASVPWLRSIERICRAHGILLIVDDIQAGCGRTGTFFSFEPAGLFPDIIVLSKAVGALGLPMSLLLMRPAIDLWRPGEHNGTFRGNNLAFAAATAALEEYWDGADLPRRIASRAIRLRGRLAAIAVRHPDAGLALRGRGLMQGLRCRDPQLAADVVAEAFRRGLIIERCGPDHEVVKLLPPLTVTADELDRGLDILAAAFDASVRPG